MKNELIYPHCCAPNFSTNSINFLSSLSVHGPLLLEDKQVVVVGIFVTDKGFFLFEFLGVL